MNPRRPAICTRCKSAVLGEPLSLIVVSRHVPHGMADELKLCPDCAERLAEFARGTPDPFALSPDPTR
jgi:hypothetical protein